MSDRNNLNYLQRKAIDSYLEKVVRTGDDGHCEYTVSGESDEAVAKRFNCTANNVAYIREMVYGKLRPAVTRFVAEEAVRKLERRVADLEAMVRELDETLLRVVNNELTPVQQTFDLKAAE